MRAGDTFLLTGGRVPTPHLWVILWVPPGQPMRTSRPSSPRSGRTPTRPAFVHHDTTVAYRDVQRFTAERLKQLIAEGTAKPRQPLDSVILERLRAGFFASAHTPNAMTVMAQAEFGAIHPAT